MIEDALRHTSLFERADRVLVAVSGGVDSMVMLDLLSRAAQDIGLDRLAVAHCNFSLRGQESDRETKLVQDVCREKGIEFFCRQFDTKAQCALTGQSTQMVARRLRYDFFDELCLEHNFNKVAIAHNAGDSIETFFVNLTRGTGLRGLTGIGVSRGRIVRPLLGFSRGEIEKYATANAVQWLNDSSNATLDYLRNRLRHDILPRLDSSVPSFGQTMASNMRHLEAAQTFIDQTISQIKDRLLVDGVLDMASLRLDPSFDFLLFEILHPYGFSGAVVADIARATLSGKEFFAERYTAILDRDGLIIQSREARLFQERVIQADDPCIEWLTVDEIQSLATPSNVALLTADAIVFPLTLRRWSAGDWFVPLGLKGQKKVSDFLIDAKVSIPDKQQQGVLVTGHDTIIWLVGRRIDDRFKVHERSGRVLRITL